MIWLGSLHDPSSRPCGQKIWNYTGRRHAWCHQDCKFYQGTKHGYFVNYDRTVKLNIHLLYYAEVRWLSDGNVLNRVWTLKTEVEIFMVDQISLKTLSGLHISQIKCKYSTPIYIKNRLNAVDFIQKDPILKQLYPTWNNIISPKREERMFSIFFFSTTIINIIIICYSTPNCQPSILPRSVSICQID